MDARRAGAQEQCSSSCNCSRSRSRSAWFSKRERRRSFGELELELDGELAIGLGWRAAVNGTLITLFPLDSPWLTPSRTSTGYILTFSSLPSSTGVAPSLPHFLTNRLV